jgi:hypothetical protein
LRKLLGVLERIASRGRGGQTEHGAYYHFWDIDGGYVGGRYDLSLEAVSLDREERFCIVTRLQLRGDEATTAEGLKARGIESPKHSLLGALAAEFAANPARVNVRAGKPARARFPMSFDDGALTFEGTVEVRMIGATEGVTTLFNVGALIEQINADLHV